MNNDLDMLLNESMQLDWKWDLDAVDLLNTSIWGSEIFRSWESLREKIGIP